MTCLDGSFETQECQARLLWTSQCAVAPSIRDKFGLSAALEYLISEKLLNFAEAASSRPEFARELPLFVVEIRRLFTPAEITHHMALLVPRAEEAAVADAARGEDEFEEISPVERAARLDRLRLLRQILEVDRLGTS